MRAARDPEHVPSAAWTDAATLLELLLLATLAGLVLGALMRYLA